MRLKTQRKVVYTTMALTVLALVGGYAAAALTAAGTTNNQNGFTFSAPTDTIYGGGSATATLATTQASSCTVSGGTVTPASGVTTASAYVTGETACQSAANDFFEEFTFTSTPVTTAAPSDTFTVSCTGHADESVTFAYSGLTVGTSVVTTNIYYELGGSGTAAACDVGVTGS